MKSEQIKQLKADLKNVKNVALKKEIEKKIKQLEGNDGIKK